MCNFCKDYSENRIFGADIPIKKCASETDLKDDAQIMKHTGDKVPGIVIYKGCKAAGYFNIAFCPMCGRKLVEG